MVQPITELTPSQWQQSCETYRRGREGLEAAVGADFLLGFHGGRREALEAFRDVPALPLGKFAACMGLPTTTVRYYTRLGLIPYLRIGRRHLYPAFACMLLARVTQLRGLGLGMTEIAEQFTREQALAAASLEALKAAGLDPTAGVPEPNGWRAAAQDKTVQHAAKALAAERAAFLSRHRAILEAQRDEAVWRLRELEKFRPENGEVPS